MLVVLFYGPFSFSWVQAILSFEQCLKAAQRWLWILQSTRLIPLLSVLSEAPAFPSDAVWREALVEPVTQKLKLVLFPCNSVVSDYPMRLMISWVVQSGWPTWLAPGATPGNGFLKKWLFQLRRNLWWMTGSGSDWVFVTDSYGGNCCLQALEKKKYKVWKKVWKLQHAGNNCISPGEHN